MPGASATHSQTHEMSAKVGSRGYDAKEAVMVGIVDCGEAMSRLQITDCDEAMSGERHCDQLDDQRCCEPPEVTALVDKSGATLTVGNTGVSLRIPPGALEEPTKITLAVTLDDRRLPDFGTTARAATPIVSSRPLGLSFLEPAELRIPHTVNFSESGPNLEIIGCHGQSTSGGVPVWQRRTDSKIEVCDDHFLVYMTHM